MRRTTSFLFWESIILLIGGVTYWSVVERGSGGHFAYGTDLERARAVLDHVRLGESRCLNAKGHFAPLEDLGRGKCGGLDRNIAAGVEDGFKVEVRAEDGRYSVKVHPLDQQRYHSLYSDQTGIIHYGNRNSPASADSPKSVLPL